MSIPDIMHRLNPGSVHLNLHSFLKELKTRAVMVDTPLTNVD